MPEYEDYPDMVLDLDAVTYSDMGEGPESEHRLLRSRGGSRSSSRSSSRSYSSRTYRKTYSRSYYKPRRYSSYSYYYGYSPMLIRTYYMYYAHPALYWNTYSNRGNWGAGC